MPRMQTMNYGPCSKEAWNQVTEEGCLCVHMYTYMER